MHHLSAMQLSKQFQSSELTAIEIAQHFLKRAQHAQSKLNCYLEIFEESALEKARLLDQKKQLGLPTGDLAAIPYSVKDNYHIKGYKTTCASRILENYVAPFTASAVQFLEEEGAICIGKTNLDECAMGSSTETSAFGSTRNPWNALYTPGGSSGGAASSLAARSVLFALGSDTGGSTRQPAAFCHLLGLKPSHGFFSRHGLTALASTLDAIAPMALSTMDLCFLCNVLAKQCSKDPTYRQRLKLSSYNLDTPIQGKLIGVPWDFLKNLHPYVIKAFQESLNVLQSLGAQLVGIDLSGLEYSLPIYHSILSMEAFSNFAKFDGMTFSRRSDSATTTQEIYSMSRTEGFGKEVKQRLLLGAHLMASEHEHGYYKKALQGKRMLEDLFAKAFLDCDVIAMPTTASSAFRLGAIQDPLNMYLQDLYTISANITGLPALSVPMGFCKEALPLGMQLMAPCGKDDLLLNMSHVFEKATHFSSKLPHEFQEVL